MDKVKLITLVIKKVEDGIYEHHMMPGDSRTSCTSAASSGYMSGTLSTLRAIKPFANIVAAVIAPWDQEARTYEVCVSASSPTVDLLGSDFETFMQQKGFWSQKWPGECEFSKIIHESEIPFVLESLESMFNER